jgi:hypothetical protein
VRRPDGSWSGLEDVQAKLGVPGGRFASVAAAYRGWHSGLTKFLFTGTDGHLWSTMRRQDGSWLPLLDAHQALSAPTEVGAVAGASASQIGGEAQFLFVTLGIHGGP